MGNLLKLIIGVVGKLITPIFSFFSGYNKAKANTNEEVLEDVKKANSIRDRLKHDNKFAKWMRKRFTR